jgi:hypothetical protein
MNLFLKKEWFASGTHFPVLDTNVQASCTNTGEKVLRMIFSGQPPAISKKRSMHKSKNARD